MILSDLANDKHKSYVENPNYIDYIRKIRGEPVLYRIKQRNYDDPTIFKDEILKYLWIIGLLPIIVFIPLSLYFYKNTGIIPWFIINIMIAIAAMMFLVFKIFQKLTTARKKRHLASEGPAIDSFYYAVSLNYFIGGYNGVFDIIINKKDVEDISIDFSTVLIKVTPGVYTNPDDENPSLKNVLVLENIDKPEEVYKVLTIWKKGVR